MKQIKRIKLLIFENGFILTSILALLSLFLFFGKLLLKLNSVFFEPAGDGIQSYYTILYHVKHDSSYWQMNAMNYPYSEQVYFTGCLPFITNPIKLVSHFIDISDYTLGIINFIMLFSIFLSALCLYLIFKHLRLPNIYSSIAATAIAYLSPQLIRLGGHYSLTFQFAIPLFLLLLLKFHKKPSINKSLIIGILVFYMTGTHFYFFGFFALISTVYWALYFLSNINWNNLVFTIKHFFIQIGFPFIIFEVLVFVINNANDRTNHPWGFLTYMANSAGIFYPFHLQYESFISKFISPELPLSMEGYAYLGLAGIIGLIIIFIRFIKRIISFNFKDSFTITDNAVLNYFFWAALLSLFIGFGYPFKIKAFEPLLYRVGLFQQLRGVARFAWTFYYVINIIAFYIFYYLVKSKSSGIKIVLLSIPIILICFDAYSSTYKLQNQLNNVLPRLHDKENKLKEDTWINEINVKDYQAIISLPYFHVGSENIWMIKNSPIYVNTFIVSLQIGLPITCCSSDRTSLSQTFKNIQMILEPYRKIEIINDFKNKKPLLVLAIEKDLGDNEKKFLSRCKKIKDTPEFNVYEISYYSLEHLSDNLYSDTKKMLDKTKTYKLGEFISTDSVKTFVYNDFNPNFKKQGSDNVDYYEGRIKDICYVMEDTVPNFKNEQSYTLSFWMDNFTEDLYPRLLLGIEFFDKEHKSEGKILTTMKDNFKIIDGKKALIETNFVLKHGYDKISVTVGSYDYFDKTKMFKAENLFIYPSKDTIYKLSADCIMINNRTYNRNK